MFGYIRIEEVKDIINIGVEELQRKQLELLDTDTTNFTEEEKRDLDKTISRIEGGIYFLQCAKNKFKK